ncbi:MAG: hypothetical protein J7619_00050 [Dyadobacter sp.]|uniref:hypothetical protein n=1 Tax=Dyadobacter sp. TaxID=1914288 RepID=UPI001B2A9080|nr:hypothetical protein [Dyadobacter sp.]MBO9611048.1 hypothetical protein [Dyadobacter sp.]
MKIEVGGVEAFVSTLNKWNKRMIAQANKEVIGAAMRAAGLARQRCQPHDDDDAVTSADIRAVAQSINYTHDKENISAQVFAGNTQKDHFAAYLEFGTGDHAKKYVKTLPYEYEVLAWQFFVNGKGTMREHPFLIPSYRQEGKRFVERMKGLRPL